MKNILRLKLITNSLFVRLLISFLITILLLVSFNFFSFTFFKNNIREEIITYNTINVSNTVENYEEHIQGIVESSIMLTRTAETNEINDITTLLYNKNEFDYYLANELTKQIHYNLNNSDFRYLTDLMVVFEHHNKLISKDGVYTIDDMFSKYMVHPSYPAELWMEQFEQQYDFKVFPSALFSSLQNQNPDKPLIPIITKHQLMRNMYIVAFLDADEVFENLHQSINYNLVIMNEEGTPIFSTSDQDLSQLEFTHAVGNIKIDDQYYFYKKGSSTGFTYVNMIPTENINAKILRLNFILLTLLIASVIVAVLASIFFSMRFNNPVKKIVESIQQYQSNAPVKSGIKEFEFISSNLSDILKKHADINQNLKQKNSLLKNFAYVNKLKNIHTDEEGIKDLNFTNKSFLFVLLELEFKSYAVHFDQEIDQVRAMNFIREYVNQFLLEHHAESITFQIENNQILSLVFTQEKMTLSDELLEKVVQVLNIDNDYYFVTISLSSIYKHSSELTRAYEDVLKTAKQRLLNDQNQIILDHNPNPPSFLLTPNQEQEFHVHLLEGNETSVFQWVDKQLRHMLKKKAYAYQIREFSNQVIKKVLQILHSLNIDNGPLQAYNEQLLYCHTIEQYQSFFKNYLTTAAALIKQKKDEHDHITSFVIDYIEEHFAEDISLDILAEQLKMSKGYLSTYFKEKTGMNFIDYLNEFRITKAKQFLSNTDLKIQEIAEKAGYLNSSSFFRMFKRNTGVTPGDYRKKHRS